MLDFLGHRSWVTGVGFPFLEGGCMLPGYNTFDSGELDYGDHSQSLIVFFKVCLLLGITSDVVAPILSVVGFNLCHSNPDMAFALAIAAAPFSGLSGVIMATFEILDRVYHGYWNLSRCRLIGMACWLASFGLLARLSVGICDIGSEVVYSSIPFTLLALLFYYEFFFQAFC